MFSYLMHMKTSLEEKFVNLRKEIRFKYLYFEKDIRRAVPSLTSFVKRITSNLITLIMLVLLIIYYYVKYIIILSLDF